MDFFDSSEYIKLEGAIKNSISDGDADAADDLRFLKSAVLSFISYVATVGEERIETEFAKGVLKNEEYQRVVSSFDQTRHVAHEQAIVNARLINRMASAYGVKPVFLGDPENRREVGHFCGEFCNWVFINRYN